MAITNKSYCWRIHFFCICAADMYGLFRDNAVYAPSQWGTMLHWDDVSHWLGAYTEWSLLIDLFCCQNNCPIIASFSTYHLKKMTQHEYTSYQGRSVVCLDVEAQLNISTPNIFHGHFRLGSFHIFNILKLRPGPLCLRLATPLAVYIKG